MLPNPETARRVKRLPKTAGSGNPPMSDIDVAMKELSFFPKTKDIFTIAYLRIIKVKGLSWDSSPLSPFALLGSLFVS